CGTNQKADYLAGAGSSILDYVLLLSKRMRKVRVCCGDWSRVMGYSVTDRLGLTAVFLDPPYSIDANRMAGLYAEDNMYVAREAAEWARENGHNPSLRIALCGYEGEHDMPD